VTGRSVKDSERKRASPRHSAPAGPATYARGGKGKLSSLLSDVLIGVSTAQKQNPLSQVSEGCGHDKLLVVRGVQ